ncbi:hypothetical protein ABK040_011073 [Willaertia magna]
MGAVTSSEEISSSANDSIQSLPTQTIIHGLNASCAYSEGDYVTSAIETSNMSEASEEEGVLSNKSSG